MSDQNATPASPEQGPNEPLGDRGHKGKTWSPGQEQGISNRVGDDDQDAEGDETDASKD